MSRRDEVEKQLADIDYSNADYEGNWYAVRPLARTLADEVDAITAERDEWKRRCEAISKAVDLSHDGILESITVAESLIVLATTLGNIIAIAEGRDNG